MRDKDGVGKYLTGSIAVEFNCRMECQDYGVPGSPTWWEPISDSITIQWIEILGIEVNEHSLPKELLNAIYELSSEIEWETDE